MKTDPSIEKIAAAWPTLPTPLRRAMLVIVDAAEPSREWLTTTEAAKLLVSDSCDSILLTSAKSQVSQAAKHRKFQSEGDFSRRRIEPTSFDAWRLQRRDRQLDRSEAGQ